MPNALARETSPYLLQHKDNPVDWLPWGEEALRRAREHDRPLLVSIGYSACHWCHVMERESFEDPQTAALMNERFVCVKVDREERPDVDALYMEAVQAMTGHGGWPLNVFVTPEQVPFYGGTYFPPEPRQGMPSWRQVLGAVAEAWQTRNDEIRGQGERMAQRLQGGALLEPSDEPMTEAALDEAVAALRSSFDSVNGGGGGGPQVPPPAGGGVLPPPRGRAGELLPPPARGAVGRRAEVPRDVGDRVPAAPRRAADVALHPAGDGVGRHLRPGRRRLRAVRRRRDLDGAALREDALRQRAARPRLPARLAGVGRLGPAAHGRGDARVGAARDARARGRLPQRARRRLGGRRGQVLRLDGRRASLRAGR